MSYTIDIQKNELEDLDLSIKNCPFCKQIPTQFYVNKDRWGGIQCDCGARGPRGPDVIIKRNEGLFNSGHEWIIEAWNKRGPKPLNFIKG